MLAAGVALLACVNVFGHDTLNPIALLALPLIVIAGKAHGLYDRDELVVNKTTMDQAPGAVSVRHALRAARRAAAEPGSSTASSAPTRSSASGARCSSPRVLARRFARYVARRVTTPERCLFVGSRESFERLRSKFPDGDRRAEIVARMSLDGLHGAQLADIRRADAAPAHRAAPACTA